MQYRIKVVFMDENILKWIADYSKGEISADDYENLKVWIEELPAHRATFEEYLRLYKRGSEIGFLEQMDAQKSWRLLERRLKRKPRLGWIKYGVAASILLCGMISGYRLFFQQKTEVPMSFVSEIPGKASVILRMADGKNVCLENGEGFGLIEKDGAKIQKDTTNHLVYHADGMHSTTNVFHTIEIPVGGEFSLILSDGTKVWLNSDTKLRYPTCFIGDNREVYVEGEAFFSVKKDAQHPFIVHTAENQVRVFGTEFNVSAYLGERAITTLTEGKVEVSNGTHCVNLSPGEQAICSKGFVNIEVKTVDVQLFTSWVKGVFEFENMSLNTIARQLSRWYGVSFTFEDENCAERRFTGGIKKYIPLSLSLDIIEKTTNVVFIIKGNEIFAKSK